MIIWDKLMIVTVSKNSQVASPPTIGRHVKVLHNKISMKIQHQSYHEIELCSKEVGTTVGSLPCPQSNLMNSALHPGIYGTMPLMIWKISQMIIFTLSPLPWGHG